MGFGARSYSRVFFESSDSVLFITDERVCVVVDHGIRGIYEDHSWIAELKSGKLENLEVDSTALSFAQEYMDEFRKRRTEKGCKVRPHWFLLLKTSNGLCFQEECWSYDNE